MEAQEYLDQHYPKKNRPRTYEINLRNLNLEGELNLKDFVNLKEIHLAGNPQLEEIKNKPDGIIFIYQNPKEWLNHQYLRRGQVEEIRLINSNLEFDQPGELIIDNYPNLERINIFNIFDLTKITISNCPKLTGQIFLSHLRGNQELILKNLPNSEYLICHSNNLNNLSIVNCLRLKSLNCSNNQLTTLDLSFLSQLECLELNNNNFNQDLSFLSHLVNLDWLELQDNSFYGSLEPLRNLNKLRSLNISNTDIDSDLEYLPESVKIFRCSVDKSPKAKVKVIKQELEKHGELSGTYGGFAYLLPIWKKANLEEAKVARQIQTIEQLEQQEKTGSSSQDFQQFGYQAFLTQVKSNLNTCQNQLHSLQAENRQLQEESKQLRSSSVLLLIEEQINKNEIVIESKTQQIKQLEEKIKQQKEKLSNKQQAQIIHNPPK